MKKRKYGFQKFWRKIQDGQDGNGRCGLTGSLAIGNGLPGSWTYGSGLTGSLAFG
jgi:hypothetical protein